MAIFQNTLEEKKLRNITTSHEDPSLTNWCVAYTQPSKELIAQKNLLDQGFEVYLPRFKRLRRHARKVEEVLAPLFPRYLFVGVNLETTRWRSINGTRGVSYLLMESDKHPAYLSMQIIEDLKSQEIESGIVSVNSLATFTKGDKVRVLEGVFKDHTGVLELMSDKQRVQLLLTFLGREMHISLPSYAVEAV